MPVSEELKQELLAELKQIFRMSWPIAVTEIFFYISVAGGILFTGHIGKNEMDAVALTINVVLYVFGIAISTGVAGAVDTLVTQSYGSSNRENCGIVIQRGLLVIGLSCLPCAAVCVNTEHLLILLGQNREIARIAGYFAKITSIGLPGIGFGEILRRFVHVQGLASPAIIAFAIGAVCNLLLHYFLIFELDLGITGAGIAFCVSNWLIVAVLVILIWSLKLYEGIWPGFSMRCLEDWGEFVGLALPGVLMYQAKILSLAVLLLVSGLLGTVELAAYSVAQNIGKYFLMLAIGCLVGITCRVGINLGNKRADLSRKTAWLGIAFGVCFGFLCGLLVFLTRPLLLQLFSSDRDVQEMSMGLSYFLALYIWLMLVELMLDGIVRGTGHQLTASLLVMAAYYLVALPCGIALMLKTSLRELGGYIGLVTGILLEILVLTVMTYRMDWEQEVRLAQRRARVYDLEYEMIVQTHAEKKDYGTLCTDEQVCGSNLNSTDVTNNVTSLTGQKRSTTDKDERYQRNANKTNLKWILLKRLGVLLTFVIILVMALWLDQHLRETTTAMQFRNGTNILNDSNGTSVHSCCSLNDTTLLT